MSLFYATFDSQLFQYIIDEDFMTDKQESAASKKTSSLNLDSSSYDLKQLDLNYYSYSFQLVQNWHLTSGYVTSLLINHAFSTKSKVLYESLAKKKQEILATKVTVNVPSNNNDKRSRFSRHMTKFTKSDNPTKDATPNATRKGSKDDSSAIAGQDTVDI